MSMTQGRMLVEGVLNFLHSYGVDARLSEVWGSGVQPYVVIALVNVHLIEGEPVLEGEDASGLVAVPAGLEGDSQADPGAGRELLRGVAEVSGLQGGEPPAASGDREPGGADRGPPQS